MSKYKPKKDTLLKLVKSLALAKPHKDDWGIEGVVLYDLPKLQDRARLLVAKRNKKQ